MKAKLDLNLAKVEKKSKSTAKFLEGVEQKRTNVKKSADEVLAIIRSLTAQVRKNIKEQMEQFKALLDSKTEQLLAMVDTAETAKEQAIESDLKAAREKAQKFEAVVNTLKTLKNDTDSSGLTFLEKVTQKQREGLTF